MKLTGVAIVGAGIGAAAIYVKDYRVPAASESEANYASTRVATLESKQPIELSLTRCDLGTTKQRFILKVYGEVKNLGQAEIPRRAYTFDVLDAYGRLYKDESRQESPDLNTYALRPGERRQLVLKYMIEPISVQSWLELAEVKPGGETNKLLRIKSPETLDVKGNDSEWRSYQTARWRQ